MDESFDLLDGALVLIDFRRQLKILRRRWIDVHVSLWNLQISANAVLSEERAEHFHLIDGYHTVNNYAAAHTHV